VSRRGARRRVSVSSYLHQLGPSNEVWRRKSAQDRYFTGWGPVSHTIFFSLFTIIQSAISGATLIRQK